MPLPLLEVHSHNLHKHIFLLKNLTAYQLNGVSKLLSYKHSLTPDENERKLSFHAALKIIPGSFLKKQVQAFVNIFCEHQLADTDYDVIQTDNRKYASTEQHIQHMPLKRY